MLDIIGWWPGILETSCIPNYRTAIYDVAKTGIHLKDKKKSFLIILQYELEKKGKIYLFHIFTVKTL